MSTYLRKLSFLLLSNFLIPANALTQGIDIRLEKQGLEVFLNLLAHPELAPPYSLKEFYSDFIPREKVAYFTISTSNGAKTSVYIDSLLPYLKTGIDFFIQNKNNEGMIGQHELDYSPYKEIYKAIKDLAKLSFQQRCKNQLMPIISSINKLPDYRQKVELLLQYSLLTSSINSINDSLSKAFESAKRCAERIVNLYDRGLAYLYIGEFASEFVYCDLAIQMYYLARESIEDSNVDSKEKSYQQAIISGQLANIFYRPGQRESTQKEAYYLLDGIKYFSLSERKDYTLETVFALLSTAAYERAYYFANDTTAEEIAKTSKLIYLFKYFYFATLINRNIDDTLLYNQSMYFALYSIGRFVENKTMEASLPYYLQALSYCATGNNAPQLLQSIQNVSSTYASLGREKLAIAYADLKIYTSNQLNDQYNSISALINKGDIYFKLKRYDSALLYANKVLLDTTLKYKIRSNFYTSLIANASKVKYKALDSLNNLRESTWEYEKNDLLHKKNDLEYFLKLLDTESEAITNWLERSTKKQISVKDELLATKQNNINILYSKNVLLDSISNLESATASHAIKEKNISDMLMKTKDSLRSVERINEANKLNKALDVEAQKKQKIIISAVGLILFIICIGAIYNAKIQRKQRETEKFAHQKDLEKKLSEQMLLNETALGHDLITHMDHLVLFSNQLQTSLPDKVEYEAKVKAYHIYVADVNKYFKGNLKLNGNLQNTLAIEMLLAKQHCAIWEKMKGTINKVNITTSDSFASFKDIEIPKHNLVNFIANSFRHGGIGKEKINIEVNAYQENEDIILTIDDDGIGFKNLNLEQKQPNRGINLVMRQIENYNSIESNKYRIVFSPANIQNKIVSGVVRGVRVIYKLVKK
jgi:hypothetical protein